MIGKPCLQLESQPLGGANSHKGIKSVKIPVRVAIVALLAV
jgi:hypothetical protein